MKNRDESLWTIDELGARVAEALSVDYLGVASGRVRDVPDLRTIRYYTTLGLLDRAAEMRGRTALYGRRHLLQLIAIKRLQARGLSLAQIQERVVGLSDAALRRLIGAESTSAAPAPSRADSFWRDPPELPVDEAAGNGRSEPPFAQSDRAAAARNGAATQMQTVPIGDGVTLSLMTLRAMDDEDLRVIRMAAAPLIEILNLRGLIGPRERGAAS
jgi:DNA-binding transcriptional MerR regulator